MVHNHFFSCVEGFQCGCASGGDIKKLQHRIQYNLAAEASVENFNWIEFEHEVRSRWKYMFIARCLRAANTNLPPHWRLHMSALYAVVMRFFGQSIPRNILEHWGAVHINACMKIRTGNLIKVLHKPSRNNAYAYHVLLHTIATCAKRRTHVVDVATSKLGKWKLEWFVRCQTRNFASVLCSVHRTQISHTIYFMRFNLGRTNDGER